MNGYFQKRVVVAGGAKTYFKAGSELAKARRGRRTALKLFSPINGFDCIVNRNTPRNVKSS